MVTLKDVRDAIIEAELLLDRNPPNVHILIRAILVKCVDDLQDIEADNPEILATKPDGEYYGQDTFKRTQGT